MGAGSIGSRHLQALRSVKEPLRITVIDPSESSLETAKVRFEQAAPASHHHEILFTTAIPEVLGNIDIAIVATRSDMRRKAVETLLQKCSIRYMLLEKLLFNRLEDFEAVGTLLEKHSVKAWVNCTMRVIPFYREMRQDAPLKPIVYQVGSGETGLVTSIVHFLDHMAYLTGTLKYMPDVSLVNPKPIESKRAGFLELIGTIQAVFSDGSVGIFTRHPSGTEPSLISITNEDVAYIVRETEEKTWVSKKTDGWEWHEEISPVPLQSVMTTWLVEEILSTGTCPLVSYQDSAKIHVPILEALRKFLNEHGNSYDYYPFT